MCCVLSKNLGKPLCYAREKPFKLMQCEDSEGALALESEGHEYIPQPPDCASTASSSMSQLEEWIMDFGIRHPGFQT